MLPAAVAPNQPVNPSDLRSIWSFWNFIVLLTGIAVSHIYHLQGGGQTWEFLTHPASNTSKCSTTIDLQGANISQPLRRQFYQEDFLKYLNVEYVDRVKIIDPKLEKLLSSHSIENDKQHEVAVHNEYDLLYCGYIQRGFGSDRRFYVAYTGSELKGYGVFAAVEILPGQVIGEYTGVLTDDVSNTDYQWTYYYSPKKDPADKIEVKLSIDGQIKGNMLRYVNDGIKHNTQVTYVPCSHDNMWHIVYIAIEFIAVGEELSVSYGGAYWGQRTKID